MLRIPTDALAASSKLTPGQLCIVVCVSPYAPTYRTQVAIAELPCNPPGSRHSLASLKVALEDHVLRTAGCERAAACELALTGPFLVLAGVQTLPIAF